MREVDVVANKNNGTLFVFFVNFPHNSLSFMIVASTVANMEMRVMDMGDVTLSLFKLVL